MSNKDPGNRGSVHNWWYKGNRVELVSMTLSAAIIRYPDSDPFVVGQAAIGKGWLR